MSLLTSILSYWFQLMFPAFPGCIAYVVATEQFGKDSLLPIPIGLGILFAWFPLSYWVIGKVTAKEQSE